MEDGKSSIKFSDSISLNENIKSPVLESKSIYRDGMVISDDIQRSSSQIRTFVNQGGQTNVVVKRNVNVIKKITNNISLGNVVYKTPDTMQVLCESKVIVRIFKDRMDTSSVIEGMGSKVTMVPINVSGKMEVKLVDPSPDSDPTFNIKSVTKTEQNIMDDVWTEWEFTVIPLKPGIKELNLVITIIYDGGKKEQVWSDLIKVKSNVPMKVLGFWEKYWQWLFTTIILPVIVYFWKKRKREE